MPFLPAEVVGLLELGQQRRERGLRVAPEVDLHRVAQAQVPGQQIDLDAACLSGRRQELGVGEVRADHQQRVAVLHHVVARLGPEQTELLGVEGHVAGHGGFAEQRSDDAGAEAVGDGEHLVGGVERALADEHRDLLGRR